jgi:hypothetical protein
MRNFPARKFYPASWPIGERLGKGYVCRVCGYDRREQKRLADTCPECGRRRAAARPKQMALEHRERMRRHMRVLVAIAVLLTMTINWRDFRKTIANELDLMHRQQFLDFMRSRGP